MNVQKVGSSFRDPSGYVFVRNGKAYRVVEDIYQKEYEQFLHCGLYQRLVEEELLIPHKEVKLQDAPKAYKILLPQQIPFISYPYEWCFGQLKDAALLTLKIQSIALEYDMSLKDASAYNVQFVRGKPIFIDTLSFEEYSQGKPWVAYEQFCRHFLAPLALEVYVDPQLHSLLSVYLDGIPLNVAVKLLPLRAWFKISLFLHVLLHSKGSQMLVGKKKSSQSRSFSKASVIELVKELENGIRSLNLKKQKTLWSAYYQSDSSTNYHDKELTQKKNVVKKYLLVAKSKLVWDIGGNTGVFSAIATKQNIETILIDNDLESIEYAYEKLKGDTETHLLPLYGDLMNPSASVGWANEERDSFFSRKNPDTILFLALVHHIAIGKNVPLERIAKLLSEHCSSLIIEFVSKNDPQVQSLLEFREDIFPDYSQEKFEQLFSNYFRIQHKTVLKGSTRSIYFMRTKK